jgi:outer membrane protein
MVRLRIVLTLALGLAVLAPRAACAETLEDAWRLALAHDNTLAAAEADVEGAQARERAARSARWPVVDANGGYTRLNASPELDVSTPDGTFRSGPLFRNDRLVMGSVGVKLPLYAGGAISAGIHAAHQAVAAAKDEARVTRADLKLEVAQLYVSVLRARRALETSNSRVASLAAHANDVASMVGRELVSRSDLLAVQVTLANAQEERLRSSNAESLAFAAYNRLLGEPLERTVDLDDHLPADATLGNQPLAALVHDALAARSELKGLAAQADALAARSRAEEGSRLPQLALTGGYTHLDNQILDRENFAAVGVGVTWRLFDGGQARNEAAALSSESRAARRRLDDLRSEIELQVRQAWLDSQAAQARLSASRAAVAEADENLRTTRELYGAGMGTNTQVLEAVSLRVTAANNRDDSALDLELGRLELAHAVESSDHES